MIKLNTIIKQRDDILVQNLDEDVVMANIDNGHYYGVDKSSRRIWELLENPLSVADLCTQVLEEYNVDRETCEKDVLTFVNELAKEGLIQVVS